MPPLRHWRQLVRVSSQPGAGHNRARVYARNYQLVYPVLVTHARFDCADGYWETVTIEELADPRVVFVLRMNDDLLLDEYSAPLRMMFPAKYGYKSAKAVTSVAFTDEDGAGYWSAVGPYATHGDIQPGGDLPQDLPGQSMSIEGGEITAYGNLAGTHCWPFSEMPGQEASKISSPSTDSIMAMMLAAACLPNSHCGGRKTVIR